MEETINENNVELVVITVAKPVFTERSTQEIAAILSTIA